MSGGGRMAVPVWRLALADLRHDLAGSGLGALSVTVALAPLLLLFGLWFGVVETLRGELAASPATREIRHGALPALPEGFFEAVRARPETGFVLPRTRYVNLQVDLLRRGETGLRRSATLLAPTGPGDPVLARAGLAAPEGDRLVLGARAAEALGARPGDRLSLVLSRLRAEGGTERVALALEVAGVLPAEVEAGRRAYAPLPVLLDIQSYQEWVAVPARGWEGEPPRGDAWGGFRLYARTIDDVEPLRAWLAGQGLEVRSDAERIAFVARVDRNLGTFFLVIFALTLAGYALSVGLAQVAGVARKRRSLAVLRLLGYRARGVAAIPVIQGAGLAFVGASVAVLVYHACQPLISALFRDILPGEGAPMRLPPVHAAGAVLGSVGVAALASLAAARRALRITPAEMVRDA